MESNWNCRLRPVCVATTAALLSCLSVAQAGMITSQSYTPYAPEAPGYTATGFGGWNLDNILVVLDGTYNYLDGSYTINPDNGAYVSDVYNGDPGSSTNMSRIIAKPWPIGEPAGIKVINDDSAVNERKPTNCIISTSYLFDHYLDSSDPQQVICSSGFQTHKRYKQAMLPPMVTDGNHGTDMVFNVEPEAGSRDYQVFQKINNWTGSRLEGFKIEVGVGTGTGFVKASDPDNGVGVANLSLSVPGDVWAADQLATFSHGLFGEIDKHFPTPGFFDDITAGFSINEYPVSAGVTDTLSSGAMLSGQYQDVPPGGLAASNQFGPWLPNSWLPQGIFFDTDGNPDTDADLVAWYGYNPTTDDFGWMTGNSGGFQAIPDATIQAWAADLAYSMGVIDDLVNVGLNYIVTVGNLGVNTSFTIRITPTKDTSGTGVPGFVGVTPNPMMTYPAIAPQISLNPSPEFLIGDILTVRVGDEGANQDPNTAETLNADVTVSTNPALNQTIILEEEGEDRGVFVANLPAEISNSVSAGTVVTVSYTDQAAETISDSSTAQNPDTITPSYVSIDNLSVPGSVTGGSTKTIRVRVSNDKNAPAAENCFLTVTANGVIQFEAGFLLNPKQAKKFTFDWTAPTVSQTVVWEATVDLASGGYVEPVTATTQVKAPKKKR